VIATVRTEIELQIAPLAYACEASATAKICSGPFEAGIFILLWHISNICQGERTHQNLISTDLQLDAAFESQHEWLKGFGNIGEVTSVWPKSYWMCVGTTGTFFKR
jgi:hypothetical protein